MSSVGITNWGKKYIYFFVVIDLLDSFLDTMFIGSGMPAPTYLSIVPSNIMSSVIGLSNNLLHTVTITNINLFIPMLLLIYGLIYLVNFIGLFMYGVPIMLGKLSFIIGQTAPWLMSVVMGAAVIAAIFNSFAIVYFYYVLTDQIIL